MTSGKIRVLLADDHQVVRAGLRMILESQGDIEIVGEASEGLEAVRKACELEPDVVVMDISMPGLGGLEAVRRIKKERPHIRILTLTVHDNERVFFQALKAGAEGYVTKVAPAWEVLEAVRAVHEGRCYLDSRVAKFLVNEFLEQVRRGEHTSPYDMLSDREKEILQLVASGYSNAQIARMLGISEHTVHNHRARLMDKLGLHNRLDLFRFAVRQGLISIDTAEGV